MSGRRTLIVLGFLGEIEMAEKKPNPNATPPKKNLLIIGGLVLTLGLTWFVYDAFLRDETPEEKKIRLQAEKDKEFEKKTGRKAGAH
jgi:hypothetical protein